MILDEPTVYLLDEMTPVFGVYKDLEPEHVEVRDWHPRATALETTAAAVDRFTTHP